MTPAVFLVPAGIHDPRHPSGGNRYDVELAAALRRTGWRVRLEEVDLEHDALGPLRGAPPADEAVLVDGLLLDRARPSTVAGGHRLIPLLHMPPDDAAFDLLTGVDTVITTSAWTRDQVRDRLPSTTSTVVALPGVGPGRLVGTSPTGRRLRCVGALLPHKGQDVLVEALGRLPHLAWHCELVGATDLDPAFIRCVADLAARSGIADRVTFAGPRSADPIDGLYVGADLLVLPSRTESYGMVAAEALACGVPVIAADIGGIREALDSAAALLVPSDDPAALAAALDAWLSDAQLRRRLTLAARRSGARRRSWSAPAEIVADVLAAAPAKDTPRTPRR